MAGSASAALTLGPIRGVVAPRPTLWGWHPCTHTYTYTCAQFRSKWSGVGPQGWRTSGVEWDPRGGELVGWSGIPGVEWSGVGPQEWWSILV